MRPGNGLRPRASRVVPRALTTAIASALLLAACAPTPAPLTNAEKGTLFEPACRGQAVGGAAQYPGGGEPHRIVIIDLESHSAPYFPYLPAEWQSEAVADAQLVGCMTIDRSTVGTCQYVGKGGVERRQYSLSIELRAAATGERVGATDLSAYPPPCPNTIGSNVFSLGGPPYDELEDWLAPIVTGSDTP